MKKNKNIQVIYACNDGYFDGLFLSMLSVVRRSKHSFEFVVLTGDCKELSPKFTKLNKKHINILDKMIKHYNSKNEIRVVDCTSLYKQKLLNCKNIKSKFSPYACFRLFLNLIPGLDNKVLYLDIDTMANKDVYEIYKTNIFDYEFAVCHDPSITGRVNHKYFNSGVMLFNIYKLKQTKLMDKCIDLLHKEKLTFVDQTALYKCATKYKFFKGYDFNDLLKGIRDTTVVKHFCRHAWGWPTHNNVKQWEVDKVHKYYKIFNFDEDYKIWQETVKKNA